MTTPDDGPEELRMVRRLLAKRGTTSISVEWRPARLKAQVRGWSALAVGLLVAGPVVWASGADVAGQTCLLLSLLPAAAATYLHRGMPTNRLVVDESGFALRSNVFSTEDASEALAALGPKGLVRFVEAALQQAEGGASLAVAESRPQRQANPEAKDRLAELVGPGGDDGGLTVTADGGELSTVEEGRLSTVPRKQQTK